MVERLEREALAEYQLAVQAMIAGAEKIEPVTVDEARAQFDAWLDSPLERVPVTDAARHQLHRILGVA